MKISLSQYNETLRQHYVENRQRELSIMAKKRLLDEQLRAQALEKAAHIKRVADLEKGRHVDITV